MVTSRLAEETQAVLDARRALRAGRASAALRILEAANARFPRGTLAQEREALAIEALVSTGAREAARQRAEAFFAAYPGSPHVAHLRELTAP